MLVKDWKNANSISSLCPRWNLAVSTFVRVVPSSHMRDWICCLSLKSEMRSDWFPFRFLWWSFGQTGNSRWRGTAVSKSTDLQVYTTTVQHHSSCLLAPQYQCEHERSSPSCRKSVEWLSPSKVQEQQRVAETLGRLHQFLLVLLQDFSGNLSTCPVFCRSDSWNSYWTRGFLVEYASEKISKLCNGLFDVVFHLGTIKQIALKLWEQSPQVMVGSWGILPGTVFDQIFLLDHVFVTDSLLFWCLAEILTFLLFQDDFPLASLPLLGYIITTPSESDNINKDYVFKLQFKNHVYFFRAESEYSYGR